MFILLNEDSEASAFCPNAVFHLCTYQFEMEINQQMEYFCRSSAVND